MMRTSRRDRRRFDGRGIDRHPGQGGLSLLAASALLLTVAPALAEPMPTSGKFTLSYTFTTSTPASPIDIGDGMDLTVNRYLVTTLNDGGSGFLHLVAGRCTNVRFTSREARTIDSHGYCNFKDGDGDLLYAEYVTNGPKPFKAVTLEWRFKSGTGKYDGISGTATDTNSLNLDDTGAYQAAGKMVGSYKVHRAGGIAGGDVHDQD